MWNRPDREAKLITTTERDCYDNPITRRTVKYVKIKRIVPVIYCVYVWDAKRTTWLLGGFRRVSGRGKLTVSRLNKIRRKLTIPSGAVMLCVELFIAQATKGPQDPPMGQTALQSINAKKVTRQSKLKRARRKK